MRTTIIDQTIEGEEERLISIGIPLVMDSPALARLGTVIAVASLAYRFVERPGQAGVNALPPKSRERVIRPAAMEIA